MADGPVVPRSDRSWWVERADGSRLVAHAVTDATGAVWVHIGGEVFVTAPPQPRRTRSAGHAAGGLEAPMPAQVLSVIVDAGDRVTAGAPLILLEAMKMELPLRAPVAARVLAVHCVAGDRVTPGRPLVDLEPIEDET